MLPTHTGPVSHGKPSKSREEVKKPETEMATSEEHSASPKTSPESTPEAEIDERKSPDSASTSPSKSSNRFAPKLRKQNSLFSQSFSDPNVIAPKIAAVSDSFGDQTAENLLDDRFDTRWNSGHLSGWDVANWVVFDFGLTVRVTEFAFRSCGDRIHDPKKFHLQTGDNPKGPWKSVASCRGREGISSWQAYNLSGVSRYWRVYIETRYSRYQTYLSGVRFRTSTEVGQFQQLSNVEREFLRRSKRSDSYPHERIPVIETSNVAELGQLTALVFIEWIMSNPNGVIGLPTGKTPELFIKWLRYYKSHWTDPKVKKELFDLGVLNETNMAIYDEKFPDTSGLRFAQLDEFFPMNPTQHNSFLKYVRQYYVTTLNLKEENVMVMDFSQLKVFKKYDMAKIFPGDKVDLTLRDRPPRNDVEKLQKFALREVEKFCEEYETKIRKMGGYGFFLGGIGHDGHIAFNFRGCNPELGTRLAQLNYETAAQSAGDFGGVTYTRNRCTVTVGLATIVYNPNARVIIMAAGEKKALQVRDAIMEPRDRLRPASILQELPGARFFLTEGSSVYLDDRRTEDIQRMCGDKQVPKHELVTTVVDLGLAKQKQVLHLTAEDFLSDPRAKSVYAFWTKQLKPISELTKMVHDHLVHIVDRGVSLPANQRVLHTSPHHDDIMLAYHEATPFLFQNNDNYFVYVTSGFNSVTDEYVCRVLKRVNLTSQADINRYLKPAMEMPLNKIMEKFQIGYKMNIEPYMNEAETLLILRRVRQVYHVDGVEKFVTTLKYLLNEYFPKKTQGQLDAEDVKSFKGAIRESECDRMWSLQGIDPLTHVFHLRSKFYTGDFFNPMPTINEDCKPMLDLYQELQPTLVTVALDPEGTGPDTHYKVLQIVAQAMKLGREKKADLAPTIWGYRNVWHRFHLSSSNIAIPISAAAMNEMHRTFLSSFGCQKNAEFPSPEYDGPFSVLSQRFHTEQFSEMKVLLGADFFATHWHPSIRQADGIILLKELTVEQFLVAAQDLRSKIQVHKQL